MQDQNKKDKTSLDKSESKQNLQEEAALDALFQTGVLKQEPNKPEQNKTASEAIFVTGILITIVLIAAFLLNCWFIFAYSVMCGLGSGDGICLLLKDILPQIFIATVAGFILTIIFILSKDWFIKKIFLVLSILCESYFALAMCTAQVIMTVMHLSVIDYRFYINVLFSIIVLLGVLLYVILSLLFN